MRSEQGIIRDGRDLTIDGITIGLVQPSAVGLASWAELAGPWEIDYSWASARATELHPFNDSTQQRTIWWSIRRGQRTLGIYPAYVTETLDVGALFAVGAAYRFSRVVDALIRTLERRGLFDRLPRPVRRVAALLSGRPRILFLGSHLADVGGHGIGSALRDDPAEWLPALVATIETECRALGVDQVTFRETAEVDLGPFRYANLWSALDRSGAPILERAGFARNAGLPAAYLDLREAQARFPGRKTLIYEVLRHASIDEALAYLDARDAWDREAAATGPHLPGTDRDVLLDRHPLSPRRLGRSRLGGIRDHFHRSGILPDALMSVLERERAEVALVGARRDGGAGEGPAPSRPAGDPTLEILVRQERDLAQQGDERFRGLSRDVRRALMGLALDPATNAGSERRRLLWQLGWRGHLSRDEQARIEDLLERLIVIARMEADRDAALRRIRRLIAERRAAMAGARRPPDPWPRRRATLLDEAQLILSGARRDVIGAHLQGAMWREFRREQDRIAERTLGGRPPADAGERRTALLAALAYTPISYPELLTTVDTLFGDDRARLALEHREHQVGVLARAPMQSGPEPPRFDADGYLAAGLFFQPRDERVWDNLADQDRITELYHRMLAKSMLRHEVLDWPYYEVYRTAGAPTGDELHVATLRAGGQSGPIVAAQTLKRSRGGHVRPERIALSGVDFGAYHTLLVLVLAYEFEHGATFVSLGQTSQGVKLRDLGMSFTDAHQYTKFRGVWPHVLGLDRMRRRAMREIHLERILEIAALPPEQRAAAAKRHGIRWRI